MEQNLSRRHALTGAVSLALASLPRTAKAKTIPADLQALNAIISKWEMMDEAVNIEGKACSRLEEELRDTDPSKEAEEAYETRQLAWVAQIDAVDAVLKELIAYPVRSAEALSRKAVFIGSTKWFESGFDYETVHEAASAIIADIQRVAFVEG